MCTSGSAVRLSGNRLISRNLEREINGRRTKAGQPGCGYYFTGDSGELGPCRCNLADAIDVESIFLFPWAVAYQQMALFAVFEGIVFILLLTGGLVYMWRKGALEWV